MQIDVLFILKITPYKYQPVVKSVYTCGEVVDPEIYQLDVDRISQSTKNFVTDALALGHGTSFPAPQIASAHLNDVLSQTIALALELSPKYEAPAEFKDKIALLSDPEALKKLQAEAAAAQANAAPVADAGAQAKAEEEQPEEEEESMEEMDLDF